MKRHQFIVGILVFLLGCLFIFEINEVSAATKKKKAPVTKKADVIQVAPKLVTTAPVVLVKEPPKEVVKPSFLIDDFEDGDYTASPEWWKFDRVFLSIVRNKPDEKSKNSFLGNSSLLIEGSTINWYIGGFGTYLGKDGAIFDAVRLVVYGNGPGSGLLKLELYDDDNRNWEVDTNPNNPDPAKKFDPTADDKFCYTLDVNWSGWKVCTIPFYDFEDENPNIGNDKWDPVQANGSGGLLQMQFIILSAGKAIGKADIKIDSIKLIKQ